MPAVPAVPHAVAQVTIGGSVTWGAGATNRTVTSYPARSALAWVLLQRGLAAVRVHVQMRLHACCLEKYITFRHCPNPTKPPPPAVFHCPCNNAIAAQVFRVPESHLPAQVSFLDGGQAVPGRCIASKVAGHSPSTPCCAGSIRPAA